MAKQFRSQPFSSKDQLRDYLEQAELQTAAACFAKGFNDRMAGKAPELHFLQAYTFQGADASGNVVSAVPKCL